MSRLSKEARALIAAARNDYAEPPSGERARILARIMRWFDGEVCVSVACATATACAPAGPEPARGQKAGCN